MDDQARLYYEQYQLDQFIAADQIGQFKLHYFAKGEKICEVGQPIESLHFLVEGSVKVFLPMENGKQLLLGFYKPLQLLGELELFELEPIATTTVEAVTTCVCLSLSRAFVLNQIAMYPGLMQHLYLSVSRKLVRLIKNSTLNLLHPLENRVASYILATATVNQNQQLVFSGNLTQIADLLGTSFRHLHRTLQSFCEEGILVKTKTNYTIQQQTELKRRAAGVYMLP